MRYLLVIFFLLASSIACRERYGLPLDASLAGSLVVEGNILDGDSTLVRLSRTAAIEQRTLFPESGATIIIEGDDNSSYPLTEMQPGIYMSAIHQLNQSAHYRLKISSQNKDYQSAWTEVLNTPDIDTIIWERRDGVEIFVQSSGTNDQSKYYKWEYDEAWDFYSPYQSRGYFLSTVDSTGNQTYYCEDREYRGTPYNTCIETYGPDGSVYNDSMYHCWMYQSSQNINVGSTAALSGNVMRAFVRKIPEDGFELNNMYSITVKQISLTREAYEFYKILDGNSENLGSIFDAQPSQLKTNIECVSDPGETVVGFVHSSSVKIKRRFISVRELDGWRYFDNLQCRDSLLSNTPEDIKTAVFLGLLPEKVGFEPGKNYRVAGFKGVTKYCIDCRLRGGVHRKPEYWP